MVARALFCAASILAGAATAMAAPAFVPRDQDERWTIPLNGEWRFKFGVTEVDFFLPDYDDSSWRTIRVPGNWELLGFDELHYVKPGAGVGMYRRGINLPQDWSGRRIFLRFEGVLWGFEFWLNGKRGGSHEIPFCRSEFDITNLVRFDAPNQIAVRVYRQYRGWEFDAHDDWALSGIFRDVSLLSVPDPHIADAFVTTTVTRNLASAHVRLSTLVRRSAERGAVRGELEGTLHNPAGAVVASVTQPVAMPRNEDTEILLEADVPTPQLWSAETPHLYEWRIALVLAGAPTHVVRQTFGIRQVAIENGLLLLNHRPIKIRGVNHSDIDPDVGRALREEHYRRDVELMKAGNVNAVRFSHYPPHPVFLDLCDRYGLYAIDAVPIGKGGQLLRDESYRDVLLARAQATVERDKNHPSVIVWSVGDENPVTPIVLATAERIRALDPTRPRVLPGAGEAGGTYKINLPPGVEIVAPHDPDTLPTQGRTRWTLAEAAVDPDVTRPVLTTAFNHALGTAFEGLADRWEMIQQHDRLAGGCIWHFQDRGLRRKISGRTIRLRAEDRLAVDAWSSDVCVDVLVSMEEALDSRGSAGSDGIVYSDRVPKVNYWITRKVFSPIVISDTTLVARPGRQTLAVPVWNRFDFTNLDQIRGEWRLMREGQTLSQGTLSIAVAARQKGTIRPELDIPSELDQRDHVLRLTFSDSAGRGIYERSLRLLPESRRVDFAGRLATTPMMKVQSSRNGEMETISVGKLSVSIHPQSNLSARVNAGGTWFSGPVLRVGREPEMAELLQYRNAGLRFWEKPLLERSVVRQQEIDKAPEGGRRAHLVLEFPRSEGSAETIFADVVCVVSPRGWLDVSYELRPQNARDHLFELGLGFVVPHSLTHLTWLGDGPYSAYPGQSEANEHGSYHIALVPDTELASRLFPGNRTRVDLAAVTDAQGNGFGFVLEGSTINLSQAPNGMVFTQLLRSAGKGTMPKEMFTLYPLPASLIQSERGSMRIVPLESGSWPALFQATLESAFQAPPWEGVAVKDGSLKTR